MGNKQKYPNKLQNKQQNKAQKQTKQNTFLVPDGMVQVFLGILMHNTFTSYTLEILTTRNGAKKIKIKKHPVGSTSAGG